jgi:hypothetical protein
MPQHQKLNSKILKLGEGTLKRFPRGKGPGITNRYDSKSQAVAEEEEFIDPCGEF